MAREFKIVIIRPGKSPHEQSGTYVDGVVGMLPEESLLEGRARIRISPAAKVPWKPGSRVTIEISKSVNAKNLRPQNN